MRWRPIPEDVFFLRRAPGRGLQAELRENIAAAVLDGRLQPGARLPSTRALARHLDVSRITVTLVYEELVTRGQLEVASRSAYRVAAPPGPASSAAPDWEARLGRRFSMHLAEAVAVEGREHPYPFLRRLTDPALLDLGAWRDCLRRAEAQAEIDALDDDPMLAEVIRARILPRRGIQAGAAELLVTMGARNAIWLAAQLLLRPGAHAACESPCAPEAQAMLRLAGARVTPVAVDEGGLRPEALPGGLDAVLVAPGHQAPTTAAMPMERRLALLAAARRHGFAIIEDDRGAEPGPPALKALDAEGRVLHAGSLSGAIVPGPRLGYLVAPAPLIREARALRALAGCHPPARAQLAAAHFIALGHHEAQLRRAREVIGARHRALEAALRREGLRHAGRGGAFWIEGPAGLDSRALAAALRLEGVLIEPGAGFLPPARQPCRFFRMSCAAIPLDRIADGVALVARRLRAMGGREGVRGEEVAWAAE